MNLINTIINKVIASLKEEFKLSSDQLQTIQISINVDKDKEFGDLNCNCAMVLAKPLGEPPRKIAERAKEALLAKAAKYVESVEVAGPGFINIHLHNKTWETIAKEISTLGGDFFKPELKNPKKYLLEFVSANPTGPLHLGHGRNGIIGDVLTNVLRFLGHTADKEFYINDAGSQIGKLGISLKIRCQQLLGEEVELPEDGYAGEYLIELAKTCVEHYGDKIIEESDSFFADYAKEQLLERIKRTLDSYGIRFDRWFSELRLHKDGSIEKAIDSLHKKELAYEKDGAIWFKATEFGDDKDRVIKKSDDTYTYIAADIAYHEDKFKRGYDKLINILGQDHHGYVKRLKGTMSALGYDSDDLEVILYQLVSLKQSGKQIKMSKRAGKFETLSDIIEKVGADVARFFYLNRKADAHLDFDLDIALRKTEENPVYYIQYAYVRTNSLLEKAKDNGLTPSSDNVIISSPEIKIIKKICSLEPILTSIGKSYQTHMLAYYTLELAKHFHTYYASNRIVDTENKETSQSRLFIVKIVQQTLALCLDLLGLDKPKNM